MLMAMSKDVRVMLVKLCDRLHNMRTGDAWPEQKRRDKALETMEVYAPIAHRLGISSIKEELEDRSLQYLDPVGYEEIRSYLAKNGSAEQFIAGIVAVSYTHLTTGWCAAAQRLMAFRNAGKFSRRIERPAAEACPPNRINNCSQEAMAS